MAWAAGGTAKEFYIWEMPSLLKSKRILNVALWRGLTLFLILSVFGKQFFGLFYFFS